MDSWVRKIPWRRKWYPTPVFLPGNPMDRGVWRATVLRVAKSLTRLSTGSWHSIYQFSSLLSCVQLSATPWTAAHQASLSITSSQRLLKLMSIELVMPSNHPIPCCPLLLLPSIFPSIRVFSNESALHIRWPKDWRLRVSVTMASPTLLSIYYILFT